MSELKPHAEKLSAEEAISRIIAQKICVRKNFHGEWFTGIVQTGRTCSTGRVLVNVMYIEDNDDEDLDADEFLCLVDVDSLAQFDSGSISIDIPRLDLSAKSVGKESGTAMTMSSTERGKIHHLKKKIALTEAVAAKHLAENTVHDAVTDLTEANEEILQLKKQLSRAQKKLAAVKAEKDDASEKCALYKKLYESLLEK